MVVQATTILSMKAKVIQTRLPYMAMAEMTSSKTPVRAKSRSSVMKVMTCYRQLAVPSLPRVALTMTSSSGLPVTIHLKVIAAMM